jgi:hypothetical protein
MWSENSSMWCCWIAIFIARKKSKGFLLFPYANAPFLLLITVPTCRYFNITWRQLHDLTTCKFQSEAVVMNLQLESMSSWTVVIFQDPHEKQNVQN